MTDASDPLASQVPSAWSAYVPILTGLARHLITAAGAGGAVWAQTVSGSEIQTGVSLALIAASGIWSAAQKVKAMLASHASSVASADASARRTMMVDAPVSVVVPTKVSP